MLVRFIKNWTLPLAMLAGTLGYFCFADIPFEMCIRDSLHTDGSRGLRLRRSAG